MIDGPNIVGSFIGHADRTFDVKCNASSNHLLTSSEDGCVKLWNTKTYKCISTIVHNKRAEVLRSSWSYDDDHVLSKIYTAGSDGNAIIWANNPDSSDDSKQQHGGGIKMHKEHVFQHGSDSQLYVCEARADHMDLMVACDNRLILWDLHTLQPARTYSFYQLNDESVAAASTVSGSVFGGVRNQRNEIFVFDAKPDPLMHDLIGLALSDSSIRFVDLRCAAEQTMDSSISLPDQTSLSIDSLGHATSLNWSPDSQSVIVSFGSGRVVVVDMRTHLVRSILSHHTAACYGAVVLPTHSNEQTTRCMSWSSDCSICLWALDEAPVVNTEPLRVIRIPDFPILCTSWNPSLQQLVCGGGAGSRKGSFKKSFVGTPVYVLGDVL